MRLVLPLLYLSTATALLAIDVDTTKTVVPEQFINPGGGKRFNLFSGDPKRIQKANNINFNDFEKKIEVTPASLSLKSADALNSRPAIKVVFTIKNNGKKTYILSFPNSQRYDISVRDASGQSIYTWSEDKEFVPESGSILVNNGDKITYTENIALGEFFSPPTPGNYVVEAVMSNYPELGIKTKLTIAP